MFRTLPSVGIGATSIALMVSIAMLPGCARQPATPEECKAAITHMMEVQLDSPDFQDTAGQGGPGLSDAQFQQSKQWLKSQIPTLLTFAFVAQCVARMPHSDAECTMSATTTAELVDKCHWKPVAGPKGSALGF